MTVAVLDIIENINIFLLFKMELKLLSHSLFSIKVLLLDVKDNSYTILSIVEIVL